MLKITSEQIKHEAAGRWFAILDNLGISVDPSGKHTTCPICGGKDRFRMDRDGSAYICNQCGANDTLDLIQKVLGVPFDRVIKSVSNVMGIDGTVPDPGRPDIDVNGLLKKMLLNSNMLSEGDPVVKYLRSRYIDINPAAAKIMEDVLRFSPACYESSTKKHMPAMIGRIVSPTGDLVALHRTYLDDEGRKAKIEFVKKITMKAQDLAGAAIRLLPPKDGMIGVAEGIETALACSKLHRIPTWSVVSSTMMSSFIPPDGIDRVVIFGDNDKNFAGQKAAYTLANRLYEKILKAEVILPDLPGDWSDELRRWEHDKKR